MDWIYIVGGAVIAAWGIWMISSMQELKRQIETLRSEMAGVEQLLHARQSRVAGTKAEFRGPVIEKARTTKRDTHDLPKTGRMSTGVHLKEVNGLERIPSDD